MSPRFARPPAWLWLGLALLVPSRALGGSMDPALERLAANPECRTAGGAINPGAAPCLPDQAAFVRLTNQFGTAFAPLGVHPARTTGVAGFHVSFEGAFTKISSGADYWRSGTRGGADADAAGARNEGPAAFLQLYSLRLRKGLGAGVELAGQFGFMPQTSFLSGGADLRWAILEGFRTGAMGYIPDLSLGGGVRTTTGSAQLQMTVAAADVRLSKPFAVQDESVITPWLGFQYLWIIGESGVVDMTPGTDATAYCNQQGVHLPGDSGAPPGDPRTGDPVCSGGSALDFGNNARFETVYLRRPRLFFGGSYQYELLSVGAQVVFDLLPPASSQGSGAERDALEGQGRQWGLALDAGVHF